MYISEFFLKSHGVHSYERASLCESTTTDRTHVLYNPRHPGQWALSPVQTGHFLGQIKPSHSPAACTPHWHHCCPSCRHTRCPRNPGKGSPRDPDTCLLRSPASQPNQNLFLERQDGFSVVGPVWMMALVQFVDSSFMNFKVIWDSRSSCCCILATLSYEDLYPVTLPVNPH